MNDQDLSALVSSRICHDLISPIGAISNGVELINELNKTVSPEIALISDSVDNATAKLRFFRIAFGAARPGSSASVAELKSVIGAMFQGRITASVDCDTSHVPRICAKLSLLALLCVEKSLPLGGVITMTLNAESFTVNITSERMRSTPELWQLVSTPASGVAAADVQFLIMGLTLSQAGATLQQEADEGSLTLKVRDITLA